MSKLDKTEITISKRKFAIELKQLVHQKCVEINHYVSGCDSPFSYLRQTSPEGVLPFCVVTSGVLFVKIWA